VDHPLTGRILYRDDVLLVLDKPSGLLVHRGWGRDRETLVDWVRSLIPEAGVHPVQRLDRGTSGVIVFALDAAAARQLSEATAAGGLRKEYRALVRGTPPERVTVDHPIPRRPGGPRVDATTEIETLYTAPAEPRHLSWVTARLSHGRLHQVRRHLKHLSHPIIGDANYGKGPLNRAIAERYGLRRLALHAARVWLVHPATGEELRFTAPLPDDLRVPLTRLGIPSSILELE
jgi:tRNA pseudouridine65 synthase